MTPTSTFISERIAADGRPWILRHAHPEDAEPLAALYAAVRAEGRWLVTPSNAISAPSEAFFIAELIRADETAVVVAEADGTIVGNALVMTDRDVSSRHVGVLSVTVADGWRDVGLGTALVAATQEWVRDRHLTRLALSVFPDNARAIAVYARAGFVREGVRRRQYRQPDGTYRDELLMAWFPESGAADRWEAGEGTP
ncbi:MAG TPA: GNAT family N-acetyltransferase [Candidatus Limnocylindria bacterium]|nr:GNAT family N-acetyltransferase [Candidatus Limnocylindria bacterium]